MADPLRRLLELPEQEKSERGLVHTPREIWQQPQTWLLTYRLCTQRQSDLSAVLRRAGIGSTSMPAVYMVGAGSSDYVGRTLTPLLRRQWGSDVCAMPSTTLLTDFDEFHRPGRDYLWISFSRSGDSPEGVAGLERALANHKEIQHLVITCDPDGRMAQLCAQYPERAFALVLDDAVDDRGLAMTSSFTNMLLAGQCLAHLDDLTCFGETVRKMSDCGERFLALAAEAAAEITTLGCARVCFVGSGTLRGVADECALKVVELSAGRVTTLAESPLGLRHGPLSSIDGQTLLVAFIPTQPGRRDYELDLLREIDRKRLGRVRLAVTAGDGHQVQELVDYCLSLGVADNFPDHYRPVLDVMIGQLIALFASMRCGLKPDQPSPDGTISRVVQPIKIYS